MLPDLPDLHDPVPLRERVLARVRHSVAAHREYTTVRRDDAATCRLAPGVTARRLWQGMQMRIEIVSLEPGAALPWPDDAQGRELLVLEGALHLRSSVDRDALPAVLESLDHLVRERAQAGVPNAGTHGATVYLRQRLVRIEALPPLEARWWRLAAARPFMRSAGRRWAPTGPGVEVLGLAGDAEVVSMLVRFAPGASVADHHHALDEDCLVIDGEMFLGDILLRPGDYQLAPAGGGHWGETSDVGVLFFFHGAIDPVLHRSP